MTCQYCNEHEATNTFWVSFPGGTREVNLCEQCTHVAQKYFEMAKQSNPALFQNKALAHPVSGGLNIPEDIGEEVLLRRRKNMLQARLDKAIQQENYEEAARLRDALAAEEKDVYAR